MGLLKRLFQIISKAVPGPDLSRQEAELIARLNPDKFYVENVRSILGISSATATRICETAVRQGLFERRIEVRCPDGAVAASADSEAHLPERVRCWTREEGHLHPADLSTRDLEKTTFYRLNDSSAPVPHQQTA